METNGGPETHSPHRRNNDETSSTGDHTAAVYSIALRRRGVTVAGCADELGLTVAEVDPVIDRLVRLRLLRRGGESGTVVPVRPDIAATEFAAPVEERIHAEAQDLQRSRAEILSLLPQYEEYKTSIVDAPSIEVFDDAADVRALLQISAGECRHEVLTVQPGGARSAAALSDAVTRDLAMLQRGVRMRVLYQHTARGDLTTRSYVSKIVEHGADVRTTGQIAERLIVFDGRTAFVPYRKEADTAPGATVIRAPLIVEYLLRLLENVWEDATPFDVSDIGYQGTMDEVSRSILRLMARGLSDEAVARRTGMALRTCRRHVASIMADLGATSRFQAGMLAAQRGLLDPSDIG